MNIAITGANGFIGSHLKQYFKKRGHTVIPIPREMLTDQYELYALMLRNQPIDLIFHLAAYGNHGNQDNWTDTFEVNLRGTWNLLNATLKVPYRTFINFGTSSEYGHKSAPMKEADSLEGDTFYAATKIGATYLAKAFATKFNKPIVTIRPFSVFGPGEADWRFIPTAIKHMVDKTIMPFTAWPQHDWIYIEDFIDGLVCVTAHAKELTGKVVNIGTGESRTNQEIITALSQIAEKGIRTQNGAYTEQPHHSRVWVADNTLLKALGWTQHFTVEQGLAATLPYYLERYKRR